MSKMTQTETFSLKNLLSEKSLAIPCALVDHLTEKYDMSFSSNIQWKVVLNGLEGVLIGNFGE